MQYIDEGGRLSPNTHYTVNEYLNDLVNEVFKMSRLNKSLNPVERDMQQAVVLALITHYENGSNPQATKSALAEEYERVYAPTITLPCSHSMCAHHEEEEYDNFSRYTSKTPALTPFQAAPYALGALKKIEQIYRTARASAPDSSTRNFYDYQLLLIQQAYENNTAIVAGK